MENLTQTNFTHTNKCQTTRWTLPIQNTQTPIAPHHLHNASPTSTITTEVATQSSQNEDACKQKQDTRFDKIENSIHLKTKLDTDVMLINK